MQMEKQLSDQQLLNIGLCAEIMLNAKLISQLKSNLPLLSTDSIASKVGHLKRQSLLENIPILPDRDGFHQGGQTSLERQPEFHLVPDICILCCEKTIPNVSSSEITLSWPGSEKGSKRVKRSSSMSQGKED